MTHNQYRPLRTKLSLILALFFASNTTESSAYVFAQPRTQSSSASLSFPDIDDQISRYSDQRISEIDSELLPFRTKREPFVVLKDPAKTATMATYDIGLGKNKPVLSKTAHTTRDTSIVEEFDTTNAFMYWNDYESVREYPSPLEKSETTFMKSDPPTKKARKVSTINPSRHVEDSLPILAGKSDTMSTVKDHPVMLRSDSSRLDVNTAWVEMLIHSEQRKFATANAN